MSANKGQETSAEAPQAGESVKGAPDAANAWWKKERDFIKADGYPAPSL